MSSKVASSFSCAFSSANCVSSSVILSNLLASSVTAFLIPADIESSDSSIAFPMLDCGLVISSTNLFAFLETFTGSMYSLIAANLAISARLTSFSSNSLGSALADSIRDFRSCSGVILPILFKRATRSAKLSV